MFYGNTDSITKGEVTYDQWKYEVKSLCQDKSYNDKSILQSIKRSVRGEAKRIKSVNIDSILDKFDSVYGVVNSSEHLLAKFNSARQKPDEDITRWSYRLKNILSRAVEKGIILLDQTNDMLCSML